MAEFVNAWLKEKLGLRRFHVRGLAKVRAEAMWGSPNLHAAMGQAPLAPPQACTFFRQFMRWGLFGKIGGDRERANPVLLFTVAPRLPDDSPVTRTFQAERT